MRVFALLLLAACSSLASQEAQRLAAYQRNAALFFDGGKWAQAMIQIDRGLELAPDDYKLNSMKGGILLLAASQGDRTDRKQLDEATALLATHFESRSLDRHEPHLLLNYARALQKQGLWRRGEAARLDGQAGRATADAAAALRRQADDERAQSNDLLLRADTLLQALVERGEMLRFAQNHRLQIALQRGDDATFLAATKAYCEQSDKAQQLTKARIDQAQNVDFERQELDTLRELRAEELEVRAVAAEFHFQRKQYAEALVHLDRVLEVDPRRFIDYYNRGRVLLELGRADDAKNDFRRFLADPATPMASDRATFALRALDR